jgi:hypothetical protein
MAKALLTCKYCGKPIFMSDAPDIPEGIDPVSPWHLHVKCPSCRQGAEYQAFEIKPAHE